MVEDMAEAGATETRYRVEVTKLAVVAMFLASTVVLAVTGHFPDEAVAGFFGIMAGYVLGNGRTAASSAGTATAGVPRPLIWSEPVEVANQPFLPHPDHPDHPDHPEPETAPVWPLPRP